MRTKEGRKRGEEERKRQERGEKRREKERSREEMRRGEERREEVLPTNELYFGILRAEGLHGSYLALTEGVDLLSFTADPIMRGQVLLYLRP